MQIYGDYNSWKARLIKIQINKCHGKDYCKPAWEIDQYLQGKYLLFYYNQIRFNAQVYGEESIVSESTTNWYMLTPKSH